MGSARMMFISPSRVPSSWRSAGGDAPGAGGEVPAASGSSGMVGSDGVAPGCRCCCAGGGWALDEREARRGAGLLPPSTEDLRSWPCCLASSLLLLELCTLLLRLVRPPTSAETLL